MTSECIASGWQIQPNGYAKKWLGGRNFYAHRMAYAWRHGVDPGKLEVCHRCDVRWCVNPEHLFLGTKSDNMRDMWSKGRGFRSPGLPKSLTRENCAEILAAAGSCVDVGRAFGLSNVTVWKIRTGRYYPDMAL